MNNNSNLSHLESTIGLYLELWSINEQLFWNIETPMTRAQDIEQILKTLDPKLCKDAAREANIRWNKR